jgi:hypothetical protein
MKEIRQSRIVNDLDIYNDYLLSMEYKLRPAKDIFSKAQLSELLEKNIEKLLRMFYISAGKVFKTENKTTYKVFSQGFVNECNPVQIAVNMLLNIKTFKLGGCDPMWFMKYPRMRLFYCLGYMLDCPDKPTKAQVCRVLGIKDNDDIRQRFITLWERYG